MQQKVLVVPTSDGLTTHGHEYLQLYQRIDESPAGLLEVSRPGEVSWRSLNEV